MYLATTLSVISKSKPALRGIQVKAVPRTENADANVKLLNSWPFTIKAIFAGIFGAEDKLDNKLTPPTVNDSVIKSPEEGKSWLIFLLRFL